MDHPALKELLAYLDGELAPAAQARVAGHMVECAACQKELSTLSATSAEIAAIGMLTAGKKMDASAEQRTALEARLHAIPANALAHRQPVLAWSRSLLYAAALLVLGLMGWMMVSSRVKSHDQARALPNPAFTPGATRQVNLSDICAANDDEVVRDVPAATEQKVFREYGLSRTRSGDFEVDYLITPGLGGSDDVANLWPEPHANQWNSYVKDQLEDHLHHMVCRGQLPLSAAQHEIASNWIAAYKKYFHTDEPLSAARLEQPVQRLALLR